MLSEELFFEEPFSEKLLSPVPPAPLFPQLTSISVAASKAAASVLSFFVISFLILSSETFPHNGVFLYPTNYKTSEQGKKVAPKRKMFFKVSLRFFDPTGEGFLIDKPEFLRYNCI